MRAQSLRPLPQRTQAGKNPPAVAQEKRLNTIDLALGRKDRILVALDLRLVGDLPFDIAGVAN